MTMLRNLRLRSDNAGGRARPRKNGLDRLAINFPALHVRETQTGRVGRRSQSAQLVAGIVVTGQGRPDLSNVNRLVSRVAFSAPALAVVAVPAAQAEAAPLMTEERVPAAGT
jgi:hypothetical protein